MADLFFLHSSLDICVFHTNNVAYIWEQSLL
jgi:hypothetical protein